MKLNVVFTLLLTSVLHLAACGKETPCTDYEVPPHVNIENVTSKEEGATRLVSYNVGVFNKYETSSYELIANMMKEIEPEIIGMNELDNGTTRTNKVNQLRTFSDLMGGWYYKFGAAMDFQGGQYGEGISSAKKPLNEYTVALPKGDGAEPRILVVMEFEDYVFAATHLDHMSDAVQISHVDIINKDLIGRYAESGKPVILAGDLNCVPESATIAKLKEDWTIISSIDDTTFPAKNICIDYFLILNNGAKYEVTKYEVMRFFECGSAAGASDHFPIMIDIIFDTQTQE